VLTAAAVESPRATGRGPNSHGFKKGLLPKGDQSAETVAKSILEKIRQFSKEADQSVYVQEGWDAIKQEIAKHESEYTPEKCASVAKEWATMVVTMTPK
jgi:hypothetical protein